jgi:hypothetical protein
MRSKPPLGERPRGWINPRGALSALSSKVERLVSIGSSTIPLTMEINDLPHTIRFGRSPDNMWSCPMWRDPVQCRLKIT